MKNDSIVQTFFRILEQQLKIRDSVFFQHADESGTGDKAFYIYFNYIHGNMSKKNQGTVLNVPRKIDPTINDSTDYVKSIFNHFSKPYRFDTYRRHSYFLFEYMKDNRLEAYLIAVESSMGKWEMVCFFYSLVAHFEGDDRGELKEWLIRNQFLKNLKRSDLIAPHHMDILYPKDSETQAPST